MRCATTSAGVASGGACADCMRTAVPSAQGGYIESAGAEEEGGAEGGRRRGEVRVSLECATIRCGLGVSAWNLEVVLEVEGQ